MKKCFVNSAHVGRTMPKNQNKRKVNMEQVEYGNTGTYAWYDSETDTYYNDCGDVLRDPSEYDWYSEGYTPFGDE